MPNTIQLKRRTSGAAGAPSSLATAEPAFNEIDGVLYLGKSDGTILTIGGPGAFLALTGTQTAAGNYTFNTGTVNFNGTVGGTGLSSYVIGKRLDEFASPTANVGFNNQRITNLADPVNAGDAATKAYVDAARTGLDVKESVRAATTANITLSGTQTIDGVAVVVGNRVLVKNQTVASNNGIYVCAAGAWQRSDDANSSENVSAGLFVFVTEGDTQADSGWILTTNDMATSLSGKPAVVVGATPLTFAQFSGAGQITAGAGLTKSGNTIDVVSASASRIVVNTDSIDLATSGVTAGTYTSVTVDVYGRVTAGSNPVVITSGKTLTVSNTLTFSGTDNSSVAFGTGGTVLYTSSTLDGGTY